MGSQRFYQPSITRIPSLLCLLVATLALIALTEYAVRHLPQHDANGIVTAIHNKVSAEASSIIARYAKPNPQDETTAVGAPAPTAFLPLDNDAATTVSAANPDDFLPVAAATTTLAPAPSIFLPVDTTTPTPEPSPAQSAFLSVDQSPASSTTSAPPAPVYLPVNSVAPTPATMSAVTVGAPAPANYLGFDSSVTSTTPIPPATDPTLPASGTSPVSIISTTPAFVNEGVAAGETYAIGAEGLVLVGGMTFNTASPTTATLPDGNIVVVGPTGAVSIQEAADRAEDPTKQPISVSASDYVVGAFIPTILAVLFTIPWHLLASAIKEIEPFYQLHDGDGALAENSIALEYRASINVVATFTAIRKRHYLVWWSGLVSLIILVLAPLASETVFIGFIGEGRCTATSGRQACIPELSVYPVAARIIQGILAFIAIITFALAIAILQRKSGVYANPLSIVGIASLFQDQRLIEDFRRLNAYARSSKDIRRALQGIRYRIGPYNEVVDSNAYGMTIIHNNALPVESRRTSSLGGKKYTSVAVNVEEFAAPSSKKPSSSPWLHPVTITAFALFVCGLEALVIYYNRVGTNTGFERFMDSDAFGVSFLFTAIGVILKMYWNLIDDEIRTMEPYRQLLHGNAKASDSILLAPCSNPFTGFFHSLAHGHFFNSYISFVAILCEPLIVALANIPFKPGTAFEAYMVATWLTAAILFMMLIGIIWMLCRKRTPGMIRRPNSIASVMLSLCGSHMLGDFAGMATMNKHQRDQMVKERDKRYAMGSLVGVDGVEREGVDESLFIGQVDRHD